MRCCLRLLEQTAAAEAAECAVKAGHAGVHCGNDVGHCHAACIVEMQPPVCLRVLLQDMRAQRADLIGHGHTGGIRKGYLINADRKVCLNDSVYIFNRSTSLPRGGKRHGDGAGDRDAVRLCELYTGDKPGDTLLRRHVKIVQIMLAAGGNIQLDFFAATVNGALYAAYIWDQRTQLHIRHIARFRGTTRLYPPFAARPLGA